MICINSDLRSIPPDAVLNQSLFTNAFSRMIQTVHLLEVSDLYLQVALGRFQRGMAQQLGDIGDVYIVGQKVAGSSVAKRIAG